MLAIEKPNPGGRSILWRSLSTLDASHRDDLSIYWIQSSGEEGFGAHLLRSEGRNKVITSHRSPTLKDKLKQNNLAGKDNTQAAPHTRLELKTTIAVILGILGFFAQFEGLRLLNWSCSIAQLIAFLVVTILRGLARRNIIDQPSAIPVPDGHELDALAIAMARKYFSPDFTFEFTTDFAHPIRYEKAVSNAQKVLEMRVRLAEITNWKGAKYEEALSLAKAIESTVQRLKPHIEAGASVWLRIYTGKDNEDIAFDLGNDPPKEVSELWKVYAAQLEAALSLSEYSLDLQKRPKNAQPNASNHAAEEKAQYYRRPPKDSPSDKYLHVFGLSQNPLQLDLLFWARAPGAMFGKKLYQHILPNCLEFQLGFYGPTPNSKSKPLLRFCIAGGDPNETNIDKRPPTSELRYPADRPSSPSETTTQISSDELVSLRLPNDQALAMHLFSAFMWSFASHIDIRNYTSHASLSLHISTSYREDDGEVSTCWLFRDVLDTRY